MKSRLPALLLVVVVATLLASCGQSTPRQWRALFAVVDKPSSIAPWTFCSEHFALKNRKRIIMNSFHRAHLAGLVCLVGGSLQIIYGLLSVPFAFAQNNLGWDEALWGLVNVGIIAGVLGFLSLGVARPRWMALVGATLTILGCLIRMGVIPLNILSPSDVYVPFILISAFLIILGMGILGIATLLGRQLSGWQAWTPLLAGVFPLIPLAIYSISQSIHFLLLGLWGLPWLLVGYVVLTHTAKQKQATLLQTSGATAQP